MAGGPHREELAGARGRLPGPAQGGAGGGPGAGPARPAVLPFGLPVLDAHLPGGGLARGGLHELAGGGADAGFAAAGALFAAGILARLDGPALWCLRLPDLYGPGLAAAGLRPERLLVAEANSDAQVLAVLEEGLRHRALAAVVGEVARLGFTPSRRLQLAAEGSGVMALVLRRGPGLTAAAVAAQPSAALTRWRITPLPSAPLSLPGVGRARWRLELLRCRGGEPASWIVEACDATGHLGLPADLADRPAAPAPGRAAG